MLTYRVGIRSFEQLCTILAHLAPKNVQMMCMVLYANLRPCTYRLTGHSYRVQAVGHGEHHVEVLHARQHLFPAHLHPQGALLVLALGAVAVAAAVVAHMHLAALRTHLDMPAQMAGAADTHPPEGLAHRLQTRATFPRGTE